MNQKVDDTKNTSLLKKVMSKEFESHFPEDNNFEVAFTLKSSVDKATELKEMLIVYENMDEEDAADLIAEEICLLRLQIQANLPSLSLEQFSKTGDVTSEAYQDFFSQKGEISLIIAEAALDTDDIEDAYDLYSEAITHSVLSKQRIIARLGCLLTRSLLRVEDPEFDEQETPKDAEDLDHIIMLIEDNDELTCTFIHDIYHHCYREYQSNMMYQEDENLGDFPEAMRRTLRQAIYDEKLLDWMYDFFEGLLSYMEEQEELTERHFRKAIAILTSSKYPRSTALLEKLLTPEW